MSPRPPLIVDFQAPQSVLYGERGIARYVRCLAGALLHRGDAVCRLLLNPSLPPPADLTGPLAASSRLTWNTAAAFREAAREGGGVYFVPSPFEGIGASFEYLVPPFVSRTKMPLAATLYDLIPLVEAERYLSSPSFRKGYLSRLRIFREADLVFAISEFSRRDALKHLGLAPGKVSVIGTGVEDAFKPAPSPVTGPSERIRGLGINVPYVMSVLGEDPRKNLERLVAAFAGMSQPVRTGHQLVVVGNYSREGEDRFKAQACGLGLPPQTLIFTGKIADALLIELYQSARLFVFPSLYEGFGLPVAEAAACDCPSITSDTTSLPEILACPASTFDPLDTAAMSALMQRALTDPALREELQVAARRAVPLHRWDRVAARAMEAVEALIAAEQRPRTPARRARLALVGPIPPTASGVADYNGEVVRALAPRCELEVFAEGRPTPALRAATEARWFPIAALGRTKNPYGYDRIIYTIGNSEHYHRTREAALKWPGVAWFHDVFLGGLYCTYARDRVAPGKQADFLHTLLSESYGERAVFPEEGPDLLSPGWYRGHGLGLTAELAGRAEAVIVHSPHARDFLLRDWGPRAFPTPIHELFLAFPAAAPDRDPDDRRGETWITTLGIQDHIKQPLLLLKSFLRLAPDHPGLRLAFVGRIPAALLCELTAAAEEAGGRDKILCTGHLPPEEFHRWIEQTALSVQLRAASNGESSAVVASCLAAGVPVITNMPSCAHWPDDAVVKLPLELTEEMVTAAMADLLEDREKRRGVGRKGREFARRHSFDALVGALFASLGLQ